TRTAGIRTRSCAVRAGRHARRVATRSWRHHLAVVGQVEELTEAAEEVAGEIATVASLDAAAVVEHHDLVDVAQRRETVGDDQSRACLGEMGDRRLEPDLR